MKVQFCDDVCCESECGDYVVIDMMMYVVKVKCNVVINVMMYVLKVQFCDDVCYCEGCYESEEMGLALSFQTKRKVKSFKMA